MPQVRLSIPDDVWDSLDRFNAINRSTLVTLAIQTIVPMTGDDVERGKRILAALEGRIQVTELSSEEFAERKRLAEKAARDAAEAKRVDDLRRLRESQIKREEAQAVEAKAEQPKPDETAYVDPVSGLKELPPAKIQLGGGNAFGMGEMIPPGGNA